MSNSAKPQVSRLLRAGDTQVVSVDQWQAPDLSELKIKEAEKNFQRLVEQLKSDAAEVLQTLRDADKQTAFEEGKQQGLTQGYDEGYALGLKEAQAVVEQSFAAKLDAWSNETARTRADWLHLFGQISNVFGVLDHEFFDQIIWLSHEIAERMLRAELKLNPEHIQRIVGDALAELPKIVYPVSIYLNPQDIVLLHDLNFDQDKKIHILPDDKLGRGECRVISGHSELWHDWHKLSQQVLDKMVTQFVEMQTPMVPPEPQAVSSEPIETEEISPEPTPTVDPKVEEMS